METILGELRYALRGHVRDWRYSMVVLLTLTVCIGANAAIFAVVYSVLLQPLPVPEAERIVLLSNSYPKAGVGDTRFSAAGDYFDRRRAVTALEDQAMFNLISHTLILDGAAEQAQGMAATPSLFRLLRAAPALGRVFLDAEGEVGAAQKVILSHALWRQLYGGNRDALGSKLALSGQPYTVVGVMPPEFHFIDPEVRYWTPLAFTAEQKTSFHSNNWYNVGRLKPGLTIEVVRQQVEALNAANLERFPQYRDALVNAGFHTVVVPLKDFLVRDVRAILYLLWAGAGFVLLIGASNIASIALARLNVRVKELGTRLALGAGRWRIVRQLLIENVALAVAGGIGGVLAAKLMVRPLIAAGFGEIPRAAEVGVGLPAAAFALAVAIACGGGIAVLPVLHASRLRLASVLQESGRTGSGGRRTQAVRRALVVAQVGLAFVLLAGAGLLLASFRELLNVDPGYSTAGVVTAAASAPSSRYPAPADLRSLAARALGAMRSLPGVAAAGAASHIPLGGRYSDSVILAEGYIMKPGESVVSPLRAAITPGYLEAMGIRLLRGRYFHEGDRADSPLVAIVDERLAAKFWPGRDPIGRRLYLPTSPDLTKVDANTVYRSVVGVVRSVRMQNLAGTGNTSGAYYFPFSQFTTRSFTFVARGPEAASTATALAVRRAVAGIDPGLALFDVKTMRERAELSMSSRRAAMSLASAFGGVALLLSGLGIYGVLSYLLAQRRREVGIRMAVGGTPGAIFGLFLKEGMRLAGVGVALGLAGSVALRSAIRQQVYGVHPLDPLVLLPAAFVLALVALAACVQPARQAARIDPAAVLGDE